MPIGCTGKMIQESKYEKYAAIHEIKRQLSSSDNVKYRLSADQWQQEYERHFKFLIWRKYFSLV